MKRLTMKARLLAAAASTLAIAVAGGASLAQEEDADADGIPAASGAGCGMSFAQSGASSNVAYAAHQLASCDALLASAASAQQLLDAETTIDAAHAALVDRWKAVGEELIAAAADPAAPIPPAVPGVPRTALDAAPPAPPAPVAGEEPAEGEGEEAAAPAAPAAPATPAPATDAWSMKLAERHAVEVAMDGLRLLSRLSYRLSDTYADPTALAAGLPGPAAARVSEVLSGRQVCVGAGEPARGSTAATGPSWYAFADLDPIESTDEAAEPAEGVNYEREIGDEVAARAAAYLMTGLASAPELGVSGLTSVTLKSNCSRPRDWPSDRPPV